MRSGGRPDRDLRKTAPQTAEGLRFHTINDEKKLTDARTWFERAAKAEKHRSIAETHLQIIEAQTATAPA